MSTIPKRAGKALRRRQTPGFRKEPGVTPESETNESKDVEGTGKAEVSVNETADENDDDADQGPETVDEFLYFPAGLNERS